VAYRTSSPSLGGVVEGWSCPPAVKRFLTESFASLFVFDGEFAHRLLDPSKAEAERAIDALCQIDLLDHICTRAELEWKSATRGQGAKTSQGLAMYKNKEDLLEKRVKDLQNALKKLRLQNETLGAEVGSLEKSIADKISSNQRYRKEFNDLHQIVSDATGRVSGASTHLMSLIRSPHLLDEGIGGALLAFRDSLDRARLPETSSRQFFQELIEEPQCVCGRPIGPDERVAITQHASRYLGDDLAGVINSIKSDIANSLEGRQASDRREYLDAVGALRTASKEYHDANTALEALKAEAYRDEESEESLRVIQAAIVTKNQQISDNEDLINQIERGAQAGEDETTHCLASVRKQLREIKEKIAEISDTVRLRQEVEAIQQLAMRAKVIARDRLREVLRSSCNNLLRRVLAGDPIQIKHIGQSLELEAQRGASVGQTLAVGYTFLASVLQRGQHEFPLIVDSPAGPLDDLVRREVGSFLPKLCDQFTAFMISSERPYFLQALESSAKNDIKFLTLFRKTAGTAPLVRNLPTTGVTQSDNAVVVDGRDYFSQFELVAEPEDA
jgi:DNA sulfur modification protein DndD